MEDGIKKNFKNPMMDFSNILPFVNGHPLNCNKSQNRQAPVDNFTFDNVENILAGNKLCTVVLLVHRSLIWRSS